MSAQFRRYANDVCNEAVDIICYISASFEIICLLFKILGIISL